MCPPHMEWLLQFWKGKRSHNCNKRCHSLCNGMAMVALYTAVSPVGVTACHEAALIASTVYLMDL